MPKWGEMEDAMSISLTLRFFFLLAFLSLGASALGQSYDLGPKYREGQSWTFKEIMEMDIQSESFPGGHQKTKWVYRVVWKVVKVYEDGNVDILIEIISCDSDLGPMQDSAFFNYTKLVRQPITIKKDRRGNVLDVIPPDTLPKDAEASFDFFKQNHSRYPADAFLPSGPVSMGEEWQNEGTFSIDLPIGDMDQIYRIKSKLEKQKIYEGRKCFEVGFEGDFTGTIRDVEGSMEGTFEGKRLVDEESGFEIGLRMRAHQSMNILGPEGETRVDFDMIMSRELDENPAIQ